MLIEMLPPEIDWVAPVSSVTLLTCQPDGMVKGAVPRVFHTMYVFLPDEGTTGHCQVPSGVFEQVIDESRSHA